jgi:hypothetical protein
LMQGLPPHTAGSMLMRSSVAVVREPRKGI